MQDYIEAAKNEFDEAVETATQKLYAEPEATQSFGLFAIPENVETQELAYEQVEDEFSGDETLGLFVSNLSHIDPSAGSV